MSEIITDANITSFIRHIVGEETAKYWTDAEVTLYKKIGMIAVLSKYWYMFAEIDKDVVPQSLVASQPYVPIPGASIPADTFTGSGLDDLTYSGAYNHGEDLTYQVVIDGTGTPDTFKWSKDGGTTFEATTVEITGSAQNLDNGVIITFAATTGHTSADLWASACVANNCAKIIKVEVASDGKQLRYINEDEAWKYDLYDDGSASTNYLNLWYLKQKSVVGDFPEALRPLIAIEAVMFAFNKDEAINAGLIDLQRRYEDIANTFLSVAQMQEPFVMEDRVLMDTYTASNPCAWSFRDGKIYLYKYSEEA